MSATPPHARRWLVSGRVQGVGFRHFTRVEAQRLGLTGWVRNLADGRVEIRVTGDPATVAAFKRRVLEGPRWGRVDHLEEEAVEIEGTPDRFEVRF